MAGEDLCSGYFLLRQVPEGLWQWDAQVKTAPWSMPWPPSSSRIGEAYTASPLALALVQGVT